MQSLHSQQTPVSRSSISIAQTGTNISNQQQSVHRWPSIGAINHPNRPTNSGTHIVSKKWIVANYCKSTKNTALGNGQCFLPHVDRPLQLLAYVHGPQRPNVTNVTGRCDLAGINLSANCQTIVGIPSNNLQPNMWRSGNVQLPTIPLVHKFMGSISIRTHLNTYKRINNVNISKK